VILVFLGLAPAYSQIHNIINPGSVNLSDQLPKNGTIDGLEDFATRYQVPFIMKDGTKLQTDVFLPITQDSLTFSFDILNSTIRVEVLPRGLQYIRYDSLNGQPNPNPWKLPAILSRTPYNKRDPTLGSAMALMGYIGMNQDMRGRYTSEGVYMPIYSDSWDKNDYHPEYGHVLDLTSLDDPRNGNRHEDGYESIEFVKNKLKAMYDLDGDGIAETEDFVYNGSLGEFGASALAYNQLQAAAAHRIDPIGPGLKGLFPIVGPSEFYKSTGFQNGVFRQLLVCGWLRGQIADTRDDLMDIDNDIFNDIHTSFDYGTLDKFEAANKAIDHFSTVRYNNGPAGYYPNSIGRTDMDASRAPVDSTGEGDINGKFSRYTNMEVPTFHVAGWWDIFVDGSLETFNLQRAHMNPVYGNRDKIKIVMGPWAHQTIASRTTGDMTYPENVIDITKVDISNFGDNLNIAEIAKSELIGWFRYTLNYNDYANIGEPTIFLPESKRWQKVINPSTYVRFPAEDFQLTHAQLVNLMVGSDGIKQIPLEVRVGALKFPLKLDLPKIEGGLIEGFGSDQIIDRIQVSDFKTVDPVRFYFAGPVNDGIPENESAGNYWFGCDTFPIKENITWKSLFLHNGGVVNTSSPTSDEGFAIYVHDPDNPIFTVGGANMLAKTPQGDRDSQGQMNLADPKFAPFTMDREGVLKFQTEILEDTLSIAGFPKAKLYAKSDPAGARPGDPTDTDFNVRIVDVYPDGREMFVVEGCVNARARDWARSYAEGIEDDNIPYTNIEANKVYEYYFQFLPIAYTFGKGHRVKILISSSNNPRYQANPNLPINDGEFFRRQPGDGKTYVFQGKEMSPRKAVQRIAFSTEYPSQIILPVFGNSKVTAIKDRNVALDWDVQIFPNPSSGKMSVYTTKPGRYVATVFNAMGQQVHITQFNDQLNLDLSKQASGQYFIEVRDEANPESRLTKSISIL
jgi:predicted acyl esterase